MSLLSHLGLDEPPGWAKQLGKAAEGALHEVKDYGRDKALEAIGTVKGVVTQATEMVDTAAWAATEYEDLRKTAREKLIGAKGTTRAKVAEMVLGPDGSPLPEISVVTGLASGAAAAKKAGLVDDQGHASLTAPMTAKLNEAGRYVESKLGASKPNPGGLLTTMELAEIKGSVGSQAALALVGAEEVKVVLNVTGALAGLKGVIEAVHANPKGWHKDPALWSGLIGMALSILGLKNTMAASKIVTLVLKFGWVAAAIPPITQMAMDATDRTLSDEERQKRVKKHLAAALNILKDAVLHVVDSHGAPKFDEAGSPAVDKKGVLPPAESASAPGKPAEKSSAPTLPVVEPAVAQPASEPPNAAASVRPSEQPASGAQRQAGPDTGSATKSAGRATKPPPPAAGSAHMPAPVVPKKTVSIEGKGFVPTSKAQRPRQAGLTEVTQRLSAARPANDNAEPPPSAPSRPALPKPVELTLTGRAANDNAEVDVNREVPEPLKMAANDGPRGGTVRAPRPQLAAPQKTTRSGSAPPSGGRPSADRTQALGGERGAYANDPDLHKSFDDHVKVPGAKAESTEDLRKADPKIQVRDSGRAGLHNIDKHHVFPKEQRAWFEERGMIGSDDIDNFTVELPKADHQAQHGGGDWKLARRNWEGEYNKAAMAALKSAEAAKRQSSGDPKARLEPKDMKDVIFALMAQRQIPQNFVPYR